MLWVICHSRSIWIAFCPMAFYVVSLLRTLTQGFLITKLCYSLPFPDNTCDLYLRITDLKRLYLVVLCLHAHLDIKDYIWKIYGCKNICIRYDTSEWDHHLKIIYSLFLFLTVYYLYTIIHEILVYMCLFSWIVISPFLSHSISSFYLTQCIWFES